MRSSATAVQRRVRSHGRGSVRQLRVIGVVTVVLLCATFGYIASKAVHTRLGAWSVLESRILRSSDEWRLARHARRPWGAVQAVNLVGQSDGHGVLILYVYSNTDPQYSENLRFFVREGIYASDDFHFVIIIQEGNGADPEDAALPPLPSNAEYVTHANECYDWGTFGWYLKSHNIDKYSYFVFLNSSVRGPYLPAYLRGKVKWTDLLLAKLSGDVKLVGSTINCETGPLPSDDPTATKRNNPHVQSYLMATDRDGLRVLLQDGLVFQCHQEMDDAIYYAEQGSAMAIMGSGYNLDCLMLRYQGVNWRDRNNWDCNKNINPYMGRNFNDGTNLHPMEAMFVKYKQSMKDSMHPQVEMAQKLDEWLSQQRLHGQVNVSKNDYVESYDKHTVSQILYSAARGKDCFDAEYYLKKNVDLQGLLPTAAAAWKHYVVHGQFEIRPASYRCDSNSSSMRDTALLLVDKMLTP